MKSQTMSTKDYDFFGPAGEVLHVEDVASIRAISLNNLMEDTYFVDVVDLNGTLRKNYMCSFYCLNYSMLMLFVESEKEDKTNVSISFESLMALLTKTRHIGYSEAAKDTDDSLSSEDAMEEFMKRDINTVLN